MDIVKNAYTLKHNLDIPIRVAFEKHESCIHSKYPELKDSLRTSGFIQSCFRLNDYDLNTGFFATAQIYNYEDVRKTLLDDTLRQFILTRMYSHMKHYNAYGQVEDEDPKCWTTRLQLVEEARRREQKYKKEAEVYYNRAKECLELSLDFIRDYDLTGYEWERTDKKTPDSLFDYEDRLKEAELLTGLKFPGERPKGKLQSPQHMVSN